MEKSKLVKMSLNNFKEKFKKKKEINQNLSFKKIFQKKIYNL